MDLIPKEPFLGLHLTNSVTLNGGVTAIVGRNGAGKSRLLRAIKQQHTLAARDGTALTSNQILELTSIKPALSFSDDDDTGFSKNAEEALLLYKANQGNFSHDGRFSTGSMRSAPLRRGSSVSEATVSHIARIAANATGKDINSLDDSDIIDFYTPTYLQQFGTLNVSGVFRTYLKRLEKNEYHNFLNREKSANLPFLSESEFTRRFGPPPWKVLNELLGTVLDKKYIFTEPAERGIAEYYRPQFCRAADGISLTTEVLSSGEQTLLWLVLSMYGASTGGIMLPPRLLLLDEPDGTLHPQMIQNFHAALKLLAGKFDCNIIFSTHSPTTVALFDGEIYRVSEKNLTKIDKDRAIAELLVGVDQVSINYTNRRQVYVESFRDAEIYSILFSSTKSWGRLPSTYTSLSFFAAAPKLPEASIQSIVRSILSIKEEKLVEISKAINGQGNCTQVIGAVEALVNEGNQTVHGIIDWDLENRAMAKIHVLAPGIFYNIENAILNPLTFGLYLLLNFRDHVKAEDYGVANGFDSVLLYGDSSSWQGLADYVTRKVLDLPKLTHDVECEFVYGTKLLFDTRYVHCQGHHLETLVRTKYPFLNSVRKPDTLLIDIIKRGILASGGRTMPMAFVDLFAKIQLDTGTSPGKS